MSGRQRTIDFSVSTSVSVPTLLTLIRRLVNTVQTKANVFRYAYLPNDVVWWTRVVSDAGKKGRTFFNNVKEAVMPLDKGEEVVKTLALYTNWKEAQTHSPNFAIRTRARLFVLYVRLALLYLAQHGFVGRMYYERNNLIMAVYTQREAYIDFCPMPVKGGQRQAVILAVLALYFLHNNLSVSSENWVFDLKDIDEYFARAETWEDEDVTFKLAQRLDHITLTGAYTKMGGRRFTNSLKAAYPSGPQMIADVLAFMLAQTNFMEAIFRRRRYKLATMFRQKMIAIGDDPDKLFAYFSQVSNFRTLLDQWTNMMRVDENQVLDFAISALSVLREIVQQRETAYGCYMHLVEKRFMQFSRKALTAFAIPVPVDLSDMSQMVTFKFLRNKSCMIRKSVIDALPFQINAEDVLGAGANGIVFGTSVPTIVVKLTDTFTLHEYQVQREAGKAGFGPKTYSHHHVKDAVIVTNNVGALNNVSFILSERMYTTMQNVLYSETDVERCVQIVDAVLTMVEDFNNKNFIHHDMKPDNIMLAREGADPTIPDSWRIIDYGSAWSGGNFYNEAYLKANEEVTPYGWNFRTSTIEDPREVYYSWFRSIPPGRLPTWDRFCLLFMMFVYTPDRNAFKAPRLPFAISMLYRLRQLIASDPSHYEELKSDDGVLGVRVRVRADMCVHTHNFPLDDSPRSDPWRVKCDYMELAREYGGRVVRLFVPQVLLKEQHIRIVEFVSGDPLYDTTYAGCMRDNCNATVRFIQEEDRAEHDEALLRVAAELNHGPEVVLSDVRQMPCIFETDKRVYTDTNIRTLVLSRTGRKLSALLDDLVASAITQDVQLRIEEYIMVAFETVKRLAEARFIHHSITIDALLYDEERRLFFLTDYSDVWREGDRPYHQLTNGREHSFRVRGGVLMNKPQYSLTATLLFSSVYEEFILTKLRGVDRRIETELATFMRRTIFNRYLQPYEGECEALVLHNNERVTVRYAYENEKGERQRMEI